ncbi:MAG: YlxR family protein [Candidatus Rokuibacteriota bacterium]
MDRKSSRVTSEPDAGEAHTGLRPSQPQRTCIACRVARPKAQLIRLVRGDEGMVRVDRDGHAAGRGAYVCAAAECVEKALQAGRLGHAFKRASRPPQETVTVILASRTRR